MQEREKVKRKVIAITFMSVAILAVLVIFLIYQLVSMFTLINRRKTLEREIAQLEYIIANTQNEYEKTQSLIWLEIKARELGLIKPGDK